MIVTALVTILYGIILKFFNLKGAFDKNKTERERADLRMCNSAALTFIEGNKQTYVKDANVKT